VVKPGIVYTTFHFPETAINLLTGNVGDEYTITPENKLLPSILKNQHFEYLKIIKFKYLIDPPP
jgi:predicted molibdopterin-dependent oxidoreductase YjgC